MTDVQTPDHWHHLQVQTDDGVVDALGWLRPDGRWMLDHVLTCGRFVVWVNELAFEPVPVRMVVLPQVTAEVTRDGVGWGCDGLWFSAAAPAHDFAARCLRDAAVALRIAEDLHAVPPTPAEDEAAVRASLDADGVAALDRLLAARGGAA